MEVPVQLLRDGARLPVRAHEHDAAFDLHAAQDVVLPPGGRATVPTAIAIGLPPGSAALVLPRSGLAAKHGITLLNAPGLIDAGYRGEIMVIMLNTDAEAEFAIRAGDRIAQLLVAELSAVALVAAPALDATERGARGLGSSGV